MPMGSVAMSRPRGKQAVRVPREVRAASEEEECRKRRTLGRRDGMKRPLADSVTSVTRKTRRSDVALLCLDFGRVTVVFVWVLVVLMILLDLDGEDSVDFDCCLAFRAERAPFREGVDGADDNSDDVDDADVNVRLYSVRLGRRGVVSRVVVCVTVTDRLLHDGAAVLQLG